MLELEGVVVQYGEGAPALDGLDLTAGTGSVTAVVGGNGAGKTTLMRTLSGVLGFSGAKVRRGSVTFKGSSLAGAAAHQIVRRGIAHVPEGRKVFADLTVEENLEVGRQPARPDAPVWTTERLFALFPNLAELRRRPAGRTSGGEQQMLTIARTLMGNPRAVLLDEPSEGLAPVIVEQMAATILELKRDGLTILLSEQNLGFARAVADRAVIIETGEIRYRGTIAALAADEGVRSAYLTV
jgi:branched-chain amino acid transport system ATP-binding protein